METMYTNASTDINASTNTISNHTGTSPIYIQGNTWKYSSKCKYRTIQAKYILTQYNHFSISEKFITFCFIVTWNPKQKQHTENSTHPPRTPSDYTQTHNHSHLNCSVTPQPSWLLGNKAPGSLKKILLPDENPGPGTIRTWTLAMNVTSQTGRDWGKKKPRRGGKNPNPQLGIFYSKFKNELKNLKGKSHTHKVRTSQCTHSHRQTQTDKNSHRPSHTITRSHTIFSLHTDCNPYLKHYTEEDASTHLLAAGPQLWTVDSGKIGSVGDRRDTNPPQGPARQREAVNKWLSDS